MKNFKEAKDLGLQKPMIQEIGMKVRITVFLNKEIILQVPPKNPTSTPQVTHQVKKLLERLDREMSRKEIMDVLSLSDRKNFADEYLKPALKEGLIEMTIPHKPNSRLRESVSIRRVVSLNPQR